MVSAALDVPAFLASRLDDEPAVAAVGAPRRTGVAPASDDGMGPDLEASGEAALVRAARDGDEEAVSTLLEGARPRLIRHLLSRGESLDDAEEVAQEALARAWRSLDHFDGRSRFYTWLYGIARHVRLDLRRTRRRRPDCAPSAPRVDEEASIPAREASPLAVLVAEERRERLAAALHALPERQRRALLMRFLDDRACEEIGATLGTTANGASMLIFRAKSELSLALPAEWLGRRVA
jgi:RNA polymerase sigma-70 factor (ECF subfamily)